MLRTQSVERCRCEQRSKHQPARFTAPRICRRKTRTALSHGANLLVCTATTIYISIWSSRSDQRLGGNIGFLLSITQWTSATRRLYVTQSFHGRTPWRLYMRLNFLYCKIVKAKKGCTHTKSSSPLSTLPPAFVPLASTLLPWLSLQRCKEHTCCPHGKVELTSLCSS